jgi:hypothetical protein
LIKTIESPTRKGRTMKVRKSDPGMTPGYPTRQQFLAQHTFIGAAALALGAMVSGVQAGNDAKPLAGVPLQEPKAVKQTEPAKESRLLGDIAVEPVTPLKGVMRPVTNAPPAGTNAVAGAAATNAPTRLPGKPASAP